MNPLIAITTLAQVDAPDADPFHLVEALPVEAHFAMALVFLAGLALWLFGGRLLKPLFAIVGLGLGGLLGLMILPAAGLEEVGGAPASLVGMGIGGVIGLVLALVTLKVAVVFAAGLGFAIAGFLGATIYLEHNPLPADEPPVPIVEDEAPRDRAGRRLFTNPYTGEEMTIGELTRSLQEVEASLKADAPAEDEADDEGPFGREEIEAIAIRIRAVLAEALDAAKAHVNALSPRERLVVLGSTLGSMALGLLVGFFLPRRSTAAMTALAGSAIWLTAGVWLIDALAPEYSGLTDYSPEVWAVLWFIAFLVGLVAQLAGLGRPKPAKKNNDGDGEKKEGDKKDG
jgi:hypothetical protein